MIELEPGLRYWYAPHPAWRPDENWSEGVLCAYYESPDALVLIDPLVPRGDEDEFWGELDGDVERLGRPVRVLLTSPWHDRDTTLVVERYGADVWAHPEALWKDDPVLTTTDRVPAGVEAFLPDGNEEGQASFFLREHRTLVTGDMFSGTGGRFHVFVSEEDNREAFLVSLTGLLALPIERVLIAHGESVLRDGAARIREALESA